MDYWEDRPLYDFEAIQLRRRRWDVVTMGLVAAAMLLSGHAVHEWLQRRYLASANSKVEGSVRMVALDIGKRHDEAMLQLAEDEGTAIDRLEKLRAIHGDLTAEKEELTVDSNAIAKMLKELGGSNEVPFMKAGVKVYTLDPDETNFDMDDFEYEWWEIEKAGKIWRRYELTSLPEDPEKNIFELQIHDKVVMKNWDSSWRLCVLIVYRPSGFF